MAATIDPLLFPNEITSTGWKYATYTDVVREGYKHCATVYRCQNLILDRAASVTFGLFEDMQDGPERLLKHPLLDLLKRPNQRHVWHTFFKEWGLYLFNKGESYIWANQLESKKTYELIIMPAKDVEIVPGDTYGDIKRFDWWINGHLEKKEYEECMYVRLPNPDNIYKGLSVMSAAGRAVDLHNEALRWDLSLLLKHAKPPFVVKMNSNTDFILEANHIEQLKRAFREEHQGSANVGNIVALSVPGMELQQYGWAPSDMDWLKGLDKADTLICNAFGVPPELAGIAAQKTYSNLKEANVALYTDAVLPILELFLEWLSYWEYLGLETNQYFEVMRHKVRELQPEELERHAAIQGDVDRGIRTRNEARAALGLPKHDDPAADDLMVHTEVMPLGLVSVNEGMNRET